MIKMGFSFTIISLDGGRNQSDKGANLEVHNQQMRKVLWKTSLQHGVCQELTTNHKAGSVISKHIYIVVLTQRSVFKKRYAIPA